MSITNFQRFHEKEGEFVTIAELLDWIRDEGHRLGDGRVVPLLVWGAMGVGKTQQIKAYCKDRDLELRTYHPAHDVNGGDLVGKLEVHPQTGETFYAAPPWLPTDKDPPGVLFIDEINRAPIQVLAGLMEPLGEGTIAQSGWVLPRGWNIVAAANPSEMGYEVHEIDEAMVDRLLHYAPGWDPPAWASWAASSGIDRSIIDFALRNPQVISSGEAQLPHELLGKLRAPPRSLDYFARLYQSDMSAGLLRVVSAGLLGREAAEAFAYQRLDQEQPLTLSDLDRGQFENIISNWTSQIGDGDDLVRASTDLIIAALIGKSPSSLDPNKEPVGQRIGYYLAVLPPHLRDEAYVTFSRSAPEWLDVCRQAAHVWIAHFAATGHQTGTSGPQLPPMEILN